MIYTTNYTPEELDDIIKEHITLKESFFKSLSLFPGDDKKFEGKSDNEGFDIQQKSRYRKSSTLKLVGIYSTCKQGTRIHVKTKLKAISTIGITIVLLVFILAVTILLLGGFKDQNNKAWYLEAIISFYYKPVVPSFWC